MHTYLYVSYHRLYMCSAICVDVDARVMNYATRMYTSPPINVYSVCLKSCIQYSK